MTQRGSAWAEARRATRKAERRGMVEAGSVWEGSEGSPGRSGCPSRGTHVGQAALLLLVPAQHRCWLRECPRSSPRGSRPPSPGGTHIWVFPPCWAVSSSRPSQRSRELSLTLSSPLRATASVRAGRLASPCLGLAPSQRDSSLCPRLVRIHARDGGRLIAVGSHPHAVAVVMTFDATVVAVRFGRVVCRSVGVVGYQ